MVRIFDLISAKGKWFRVHLQVYRVPVYKPVHIENHDFIG
jgi:hypothetical protein